MTRLELSGEVDAYGYDTGLCDVSPIPRYRRDAGGRVTLPPRVEREVRRITRQAVTRLVDERLDADTSNTPTGRNDPRLRELTLRERAALAAVLRRRAGGQR